MRVGWLRLLVEIAFILGVAAVTWALEVNKVWIVVLVLLAWVLTALLERSAAQRGGSLAPSAGEVRPGPAADGAGRQAEEALPPQSRRGLSRLVAALAGGRPEPREERRRGWPGVATPDVAVRACETCGNPIALERLLAVPDATQCLDCRRAGQAAAESAPARPEPEPVREPELAPVVEERIPQPVHALGPETAAQPGPAGAATAAPAPAVGSRWNVWELERLARERSGEDVARDEEWGFLLVYLREFADADGNLSPDFDGLVRESFADLIA